MMNNEHIGECRSSPLCAYPFFTARGSGLVPLKYKSKRQRRYSASLRTTQTLLCCIFHGELAPALRLCLKNPLFQRDEQVVSNHAAYNNNLLVRSKHVIQARYNFFYVFTLYPRTIFQYVILKREYPERIQTQVTNKPRCQQLPQAATSACYHFTVPEHTQHKHFVVRSRAPTLLLQ